MCEPNPVTFLRTCSLKPVTMATDKIMTAIPKAIPKIAMVSTELEIPPLLSLAKNNRRAMNNSTFK